MTSRLAVISNDFPVGWLRNNGYHYFLRIKGVIIIHFVPPKTTFNGNAYANLSCCQLFKERSEILMHHDNAQSYSSRKC